MSATTDNCLNISDRGEGLRDRKTSISYDLERPNFGAAAHLALGKITLDQLHFHSAEDVVGVNTTRPHCQ